MRVKGLLAGLLLGVGLCFVAISVHGEVRHELWWETQVPLMEFLLLQARVDHMMRGPTNFLDVRFHYDPDGRYQIVAKLPENLDTMGKIYVDVRDNRGVFSGRSQTVLLELFKRALESLYSFIDVVVATDMDTDIVAKFIGEEGNPLGYFYQGEYYLWGQ